MKVSNFLWDLLVPKYRIGERVLYKTLRRNNSEWGWIEDWIEATIEDIVIEYSTLHKEIRILYEITYNENSCNISIKVSEPYIRSNNTFN